MCVLFCLPLIPIREGLEGVRIHHVLVVNQLVFFSLGHDGQLVFLGVPHDFEWYGHSGDACFARLQWGSQVFQHIVFEDFKIDISLPQTIECDASDFTVLFTFVGLVPAVFWTSGGKFHYMVVWRQFVLQVSQIISQWWLGHSLGGMEHD